MFQTSEISEFAKKILALDPDSIPRYLLMRDILQVPPDEPEMKQIKAKVLESGWVSQLAEAQDKNGIWGRFHSQDTKVRSVFPTTEFAVQRALTLGLDMHDRVLARAVTWMEKCLDGKASWLDRVEKSEAWPSMTRTITASTLARVDPSNPLIIPERERWVEIAQQTFDSGVYDPVAEQEAQLNINGLKTRSYYTFHVSHPLILLSATPGLLPLEIEKAMINWVYKNPKGVGYVTPGRLSNFPNPTEHRFTPWLEGLRILLRFHSGSEILSDALDYIQSLRSPDGFWQYNGLPGTLSAFPLSDSWRKPVNKKIDQTILILSLFTK